MILSCLDAYAHSHPAVLLALSVAHDRPPRARPLGAVLVLLQAAGEGPAIDLYRVTHQDGKNLPVTLKFGMFRYPAWPVDSYTNSKTCKPHN